MSRSLAFVVIGVFSLAGCKQQTAPPVTTATPTAAPATPAPATWIVTETGVGPVTVGMTDIELRTVVNDRLEGPPQSDGCAMVKLLDAPGDVLAMLVDGRVVRVDVTTADVHTSAQIAVGDTESQVQAAYPGRVKVQPHKYTDGHYLNVDLPSRRRLVFETDGKVVTRYRVGARPQVDWVEGCS